MNLEVVSVGVETRKGYEDVEMTQKANTWKGRKEGRKKGRKTMSKNERSDGDYYRLIERERKMEDERRIYWIRRIRINKRRNICENILVKEKKQQNKKKNQHTYTTQHNTTQIILNTNKRQHNSLTTRRLKNWLILGSVDT